MEELACHVNDTDASLHILQYDIIALLTVLKWQILITVLNKREMEMQRIETALVVTTRHTYVNFFFNATVRFSNRLIL